MSKSTTPNPSPSTQPTPPRVPGLAAQPRPVARLTPGRVAAVLVDLQEKLVPVIDDGATVVRRADRLARGAEVLGVPLLVTEQHPRGLGPTVRSLRSTLPPEVPRLEKTRFSAAGPKLLAQLRTWEASAVVLAGVEAHVCVLQTALDLLDEGFVVAVCRDACGSRRAQDRDAGLARMEASGVLPATVESVLFELCGDAAAPAFAALSRVIR